MSRLPTRVRTITRALAFSLCRRTSIDRLASESVRKILIANHLLLGDTILLAPLLKKLVAAYPAAETTVLVRPPFLPLFEGKPYRSNAVAFDPRNPESHSSVLRSGPYDLAIVPDDNRYAWLARAARAKWVVGFAADKPVWKNWMLDRAVPYPDRRPEGQAWADMATALVPGPEPERYRDGEWRAPYARVFDLPGAPYAVLHIGASTPLKFWAAERWRALADRLRAAGVGIVWSGGKGEGAILGAVGPRADETDLMGKLDLAQLWALLAGARLLVCPDTGIAHLARVVGVPTVALFGPGSGVVHGQGRFWSDALFRIVTEAEFPCRNQHVLFRRELAWVRRCGRSYGGVEVGAASQCAKPLCMEAVGVGSVVEIALQLIDAGATRQACDDRQRNYPD